MNNKLLGLCISRSKVQAAQVVFRDIIIIIIIIILKGEKKIK